MSKLSLETLLQKCKWGHFTWCTDGGGYITYHITYCILQVTDEKIIPPPPPGLDLTRGAYVKLAERIYNMYDNLKNGNSQELDYKLLLRK